MSASANASSSSSSTSTAWFQERAWSVSGNKVVEELLGRQQRHPSPSTSSALLFPKSAVEIAQYLSSNNDRRDCAIAVVCGGHSSSNVATWPIFLDDEERTAKMKDDGTENEDDDEQQQQQRPCSTTTTIIDMKHMSSIRIHHRRRDDETTSEVTVGGGVLFRRLAETCSALGCALPIGTGPTVGVSGYVLNGGISGYFGRRLGMLGQRVTGLEIVLADGEIKTLSAPRMRTAATSSAATAADDNDEDELLFRACLGAGSALGVVTSLTLKMEKDSIFRTGGSIVFACPSKSIGKSFLKKALAFMKERVLMSSSWSTSMEIVTTSDFTIVCTLMFYDSFDGDPENFVDPLRDAAREFDIPIVADAVSSHETWFEAASSLWGVIDGMKGSPLVRMDHCMGTEHVPSDEAIDFLLDRWFGSFLEKAPLTIIEIRTLGGAASADGQGNRCPLPTGNAKCTFFVDMIVSYDASAVTAEDKASIRSEVHEIIVEAKKRCDIMVDFSGTHGQSDDPSTLLPDGETVFGGKENHNFIRAMKTKYDPNNRFCYHPFNNLI